MPSTLVAFINTSTPSSLPRRAAAVSVVTNGLPVPVASTMTRLAVEVRQRPAADERLGDLVHLDRGHQPGLAAEVPSSASCRARPLMTVAVIPM